MLMYGVHGNVRKNEDTRIEKLRTLPEEEFRNILYTVVGIQVPVGA
jgi:hypothetical protein